jgi:hypothetical protein
LNKLSISLLYSDYSQPGVSLNLDSLVKCLILEGWQITEQIKSSSSVVENSTDRNYVLKICYSILQNRLHQLRDSLGYSWPVYIVASKSSSPVKPRLNQIPHKYNQPTEFLSDSLVNTSGTIDSSVSNNEINSTQQSPQSGKRRRISEASVDGVVDACSIGNLDLLNFTEMAILSSKKASLLSNFHHYFKKELGAQQKLEKMLKEYLVSDVLLQNGGSEESIVEEFPRPFNKSHTNEVEIKDSKTILPSTDITKVREFLKQCREEREKFTFVSQNLN